MSRTMQRFCVLTVGRAGSTSLMNRLASFPDVAVPGRNLTCVDQELLHPKRVREYMAGYSRLCGTLITRPRELIDRFFELNSGAAYAGFKSMPDRHPDLEEFVARPDIRFITLTRRDIASTVASFLTAQSTDSWRRFGEPQQAHWRFESSRDSDRVLANLGYIQQSEEQLRRIPRAIRLSYEELCDPGFCCPPMDDLFGRPVRLEDPKPPTSAASYVDNWEEFRDFVEREYRRLSGVKES